ncbi:hypothetical protein NE237_026989 [Protea cynaroides]|uniref:Lunapark zinc ribbon domain-containing protein n=1 Tax=Protea cynaroides TaxID=273540 RepID=A0A9Q0GQD6_9MAGN|nr:hypothetical protein NE237_026989 [Protea cynaroides]
MSTNKKEEGEKVMKQKRGIISRIWNGLFRARGEDIETRLQYICKEEASVLARMKKRSQSWKSVVKKIMIFFGMWEVIAVVYAILSTRSLDLHWKIRALRVFPIFLTPALSFIVYSALVRWTRMRDRKDQQTLEKLHAERQTKIDELKERTNYYRTQQLIQRYDPDPAAKAAAATILASKLGSDSGLKVYLGDESKFQAPSGKSNDFQSVQSSGLRNRKQSQTGSSSGLSTVTHQSVEKIHHDLLLDDSETVEQNQMAVEHDPRPAVHNEGWIARIAALLVGEDPTQCYALICSSCYMHNGLARKDDFPYITYYCPHCRALNGPRQQLEEHVSGSISANTISTTSRKSDVVDNSSPGTLSRNGDVVDNTSPDTLSRNGDVVDNTSPSMLSRNGDVVDNTSPSTLSRNGDVVDDASPSTLTKSNSTVAASTEMKVEETAN